MQSEKKFIVVTGATKGLGRAMVEEFAAQGHQVAGCGRSASAIAELNSGFGSPHRFAELDVLDDARVADWSGEIVSEFGAPDLLINNAGVMNEPAALWEVPVDEFSNVIDVNIKGVANVIRHFVPAMIERGRGVVVNFSSGWGRSTSPEVAAYCATKWAIEGLTQALAQELPNPLAAVPLNPGVINTDMLQQCFGSGADGYPDPKQWSKSAVRLLLGLDRKDNGQSLSV